MSTTLTMRAYGGSNPPVRVRSPLGEYYVTDPDRAPSAAEGDDLYARMIRVRELDRDWSSLPNGRKRSISTMDGE